MQANRSGIEKSGYMKVAGAGRTGKGTYCQGGLHKGSGNGNPEYLVEIDPRKKFMQVA